MLLQLFYPKYILDKVNEFNPNIVYTMGASITILKNGNILFGKIWSKNCIALFG